MDLNEAIHALNIERQRLDEAIVALSGGVPDGRRRGRLTGLGATVAPKRRRMSAAGREKISAAAKARWAKAKRAGKNSL